MTHLNIVSGFLGSGKTTLLRKVIPHLNGKLALIENEFGKVGIDGELFSQAIPKKEVYAGCICCSISKEFTQAVEEMIVEHRPARLLIEPSGVGSLSEIIKLCRRLTQNKNLDITIDPCITLVDVSAYDDYIENFGSFYQDQIEHAGVILLSYINSCSKNSVDKVIESMQSINPTAVILNEDWLAMEEKQLWDTLESSIKYHKNIEDVALSDSIKMPPFTSVSIVNPNTVTVAQLEQMLKSLHHDKFGDVLRAKGFIQLNPVGMAHFDFTPHHSEWHPVTEVKNAGIAVIGTRLNKPEIIKHFKETLM